MSWPFLWQWPCDLRRNSKENNIFKKSKKNMNLFPLLNSKENNIIKKSKKNMNLFPPLNLKENNILKKQKEYEFVPTLKLEKK